MTQIVPNNIYPSQNFYNDPRTHIISESNQIRVTTEAAPPNIQPSILINISQRHTFNLTGKLHIRNMNPISRYQLYIDNYNSLEFQPPLNNIPNFWVILRIYDFILYCIQSVQYFTIFVLIFVISLISSLFESKKNKNNKSFDQTIKCLSLGFSDEKCILFIKLFLGAIFIILMVIVPGLNIAFVAILGLLTIYYFVFLIGWYIPNICKVNIFSRCIYVRKDNPLLGDFRNNFIEINSNNQIDIYARIPNLAIRFNQQNERVSEIMIYSYGYKQEYDFLPFKFTVLHIISFMISMLITLSIWGAI